jgi:hypothetical protein
MVPATALALQSQRGQIGITILVNVTNPLGYKHQPGATDTNTIVASAHLHGAPLAIERAFEAQQLHFVQRAASTMVAANTGGVKVEAEITPNPNATLLTSDAPGYAVTLNATAGVPMTVTCAYHVKVQTTVTNWQLKHGLSADFTNGVKSWNGSYLSNNSYSGGTPLPTSTPFTVYADNGGSWAILGNGSLTQQYCVDLIINVPTSVLTGTYSSNAIYTLFY